MRRDTCYYDGQCGLCRRSARVLRSLDWLGSLRFTDLMSLPLDQLPVSPEAMLKGMPMRTARGNVLIGFPAVRRALLRTPLGAPAAALLYVPGIAWLGRRVYGRIATPRGRAACERLAASADRRLGPA